jgi:L-fuconolactonase
VSAAAQAQTHESIKIDEAWLSKWQEDVIDPDLPVVDVHHHLWVHSGRYLLDELLADTGSGHNVRSSVFVQCRSMYRADGPAEMRPVGETEFVNGAAAMSASGHYGPARLCAGIIGWADLTLGAKAVPVLEAHIRAGNGRFRGIRVTSSHDPDPALWPGPARSIPGLLTDSGFREALGSFAQLGLLFEPIVFHHQLPELIAVARAFPDTQFVLNHAGGILTRGKYATQTEEVYALWRKHMKELARSPNVAVKVGGMARRTPGVTFPKLERPPSSQDLAGHWRRYFEACIEDFGADRCMFESNFPVDKSCYSYRVVWNAFKRITANYSAAEKAALFSENAYRIYRLNRV